MQNAREIIEAKWKEGGKNYIKNLMLCTLFTVLLA